MQIDFVGSPQPTLGVEIELELVDPQTRELVPLAEELLAALADPLTDTAHPKAKPELLECCVEVVTGICADVDEVCADLAATLEAVSSAADGLGIGLLSSGTHPTSYWPDRTITGDPRYQELLGQLQWVARRMQIFGMHVHVGVPSGPRAIAVANGLCNYVPHLLALTASSPFWNGADTGLASVRSKVFENLPTAGLPEHLDSWDEYRTFVGTLVEAGSISSIREIWWDVRPHPDFGTVELRMCDAVSNLAEVGAVTALAQCLTVAIDRASVGSGPPLAVEPGRAPDWLIRQNKWRAARYGLDAEFIIDTSGRCVAARDALAALVGTLAPVAEELRCGSHLAEVLDMLSAGTSADRQRAVVAAGGSLADVVDHLAAELRSGHAHTTGG